MAQVAHFDTESRIPPDKFAYALNVGLPRDIRVIYSDMAEGFHARFDVIRKHYRYTVNNAPHAGVFNRNTALHYHYALDMDKMKRAAGDLLGEHDFLAFKSAGTELGVEQAGQYTYLRYSGQRLYVQYGANNSRNTA